jgi:DNA-binding transcriptional regulator PaaX
MGDSEALGRKLDRLCALVALAFAPQIAAERQRIRADGVASELLDRSEGWVSAGELQEVVATAQNVSTRTVRTRLSELVSTGAIEARAVGRNIEHRNTGLI